MPLAGLYILYTTYSFHDVVVVCCVVLDYDEIVNYEKTYDSEYSIFSKNN